MRRRTTHVSVTLGDRSLGGAEEVVQVVPVREPLGRNRRQDANTCPSGVEDLRSWFRDTVISLDNHGEHGELCIDRDPEPTLLEWQEFAIAASCAFREDDEGVTPLRREYDPFLDRDSARTARLSVDLDHADARHCSADERDVEQFLFREEPSFDRKDPQQQRNVECGLVVRCDDVSRVRVNMLNALNVEPNRWDAKEPAAPPPYDLAWDRRSRPDRTNREYDGCQHEREQEEERHEHEGADSGERGLEHVR